MRVRSEVAEAHERLATGILEDDAFAGALGGDENLVLRHFAKPDVVRTVHVELADGARALRDDQAVSAGVLDRGGAAGEDGQLTSAEKLHAVHGPVDNPLVHEALPFAAGADDGFEVVVVLERGIDVLRPVKLFDEVVKVLVLVFGNVLHEQFPGDATAFDHRLVHAEDVRTPLRLVGNERAGGVQHARGDQPAGAGLEAVRLGEVKDAVVPFIPALQALAEVFLRGARFQTHEGIRKVVAGPVELGREIIALGLPLAAELRGLLGVLVHVVGDRAEVVEELGVDRPFLVLRPEGVADQLRAVRVDGVLEGELVAVGDDVAQPLVGGRAVVGGGSRRTEPALVDPSTVGPQRVEVLRGQLETSARHQEGTGDPGRGQPQDAFARVERRAGARGGVLIAHPFQPFNRGMILIRGPPARRPGPCLSTLLNCLQVVVGIVFVSLPHSRRKSLPVRPAPAPQGVHERGRRRKTLDSRSASSGLTR